MPPSDTLLVLRNPDKGSKFSSGNFSWSFSSSSRNELFAVGKFEVLAVASLDLLLQQGEFKLACEPTDSLRLEKIKYTYFPCLVSLLLSSINMCLRGLIDSGENSASLFKS